MSTDVLPGKSLLWNIVQCCTLGKFLLILEYLIYWLNILPTKRLVYLVSLKVFFCGSFILGEAIINKLYSQFCFFATPFNNASLYQFPWCTATMLISSFMKLLSCLIRYIYVNHENRKDSSIIYALYVNSIESQEQLQSQ